MLHRPLSTNTLHYGCAVPANERKERSWSMPSLFSWHLVHSKPPFLFSPCHPCSANFAIKRNREITKNDTIYLSIYLSVTWGEKRSIVCGPVLFLFIVTLTRSKRRSCAGQHEKKKTTTTTSRGLKKWVNSSERGHVVKKGTAINIPVDYT
jgi:hypothetical protein